jgi:adenylylsulfate kinase
MIVFTAFISPFRSDRQQVRKLLGQRFIEIYCDCPLNICENRDVKGLYKRARSGEVKEFTGISSPYEVPEAAEITVNTDQLDLHESIEKIVRYLADQKIICSPAYFDNTGG